jgi:hypothetical protein
VTITLQAAKTGLILEDILAGAGGGGGLTAPCTGPVDARVDGFGIGSHPLCLTINQHNRQVYRTEPFSLGPGTWTFGAFVFPPSNLGCYRSITNEVHLDQQGVQGHLATARAAFSVNCNTRFLLPDL